ncbi:hypothetical protein FLJC2902T_22490 [Flavobacterium limnosediminis JC2902]|uniref:Bacteroidetes-specific membrane protein n=1 Tax=Flavobacterium limnosediminis JC2902 TaxID=1341181 RepID=V6SKE1_9FLAO|nr:PorP/SprF family type IX secretion system membrane protein [Flavobacterium limnosediminis]ESU27071.1 hypothetical protein FLJC2902T_22490 [Flavobacterium limnosediminis JC2902]
MKFKYIITITVALFSNFINAQDPIFTQAFLMPETMNPGYTGFLETTSAGIIHRTQWPDLNFRVDTNYGYFSTWLEDANSGVGVNFLSHREDFTGYNYMQANANYAYRVALSDYWYFRPGIEVGYGSKSYGFQNLILRDQINIANETINPESIDPMKLNNRLHFFDMSAGLLFYNDNIWFGTSLKHLTKPNISMAQEGNIPLDMFFTVNAGYEFELAEYVDVTFFPYETRMTLTANFMKQGEYNRLDLGTSLLFNKFFVGATTAINPMEKAYDSHTVTSVNLFGGLQYENFKIGYSYDISTSKLKNTGGVYELSLVYQFDVEARKCFGCPNYLVK